MPTIQIRVNEDFKNTILTLAEINGQNMTEYIKHLVLIDAQKEGVKIKNVK